MKSRIGRYLAALSLRFDDNVLENQFDLWSQADTQFKFSLTLLMSAISSLLVFGLDSLTLGQFELSVFCVRVIAFPLNNLVLALYVRYSKLRARARWDIAGIAFALTSQFWQFLVVIGHPQLGTHYLLGMLLLSFSATIAFSSTSFRFTLPTFLLVLIAFLLKIVIWDNMPTADLAFEIFISIMITGICLSAGFMLERSRRLEFKNQIGFESKQRELEGKNKELEQFAYIASHDLQEPLRSITSFSQLLNEEHRDQVGEDGGQYLDFLLEASERMRRLIKGLLDYSRLGRESNMVQTESAQVLQDILKDLSLVIKESQSKIVATNMPRLKVYEVEFRQLLQNLLSNAIKFRRPGIAPEIHISAKKVGSHWEFSVKDNGIGISQEYHEKVFLIFQRLHSRSQYDGTGIGLANCRKIVELHGGTIHVDSAEQQGSNFIFTIPIR